MDIYNEYDCNTVLEKEKFYSAPFIEAYLHDHPDTVMIRLYQPMHNYIGYNGMVNPSNCYHVVEIHERAYFYSTNSGTLHLPPQTDFKIVILE